MEYCLTVKAYYYVKNFGMILTGQLDAPASKSEIKSGITVDVYHKNGQHLHQTKVVAVEQLESLLPTTTRGFVLKELFSNHEVYVDAKIRWKTD